MTEFEQIHIPQLAQQRLEITAVDCQQRSTELFALSLDIQRRLLGLLSEPARPLMDATGARVPSLAEGKTTPPRLPGFRLDEG